MVTRIISGGQTGADRGGLDAPRESKDPGIQDATSRVLVTLLRGLI